MEIKKVKMTDIRPYERNPRRNDQAVDAVAASIREFGWQQPIVVDREGVIIAGHTRYKAAKKLELEEVPVVVADGLSPEQVKAYRLADNKTGEKAEWDLSLLDVELAALCDMDMERFGFEGMDFGEDETDEAEEDGYEVELPDEPRAKPGEIYQLGRHRLMCGDSTNKEAVAKLCAGGLISC